MGGRLRAARQRWIAIRHPDLPPPEIHQLFGALYGNQAETDRFLGTILESVPIPEFFARQECPLVADRDTRILTLEGTLLRHLTLDPSRPYQPLAP